MDLRETLRLAFDAFDKGELGRAADLYQRVLEAHASGDIHAHALHGLGFVRSQQGRFLEARELYLKLLEHAEAQGNLTAQHRAMHQLGMVERLAGRFETALHWFQREHGLLEHLTEGRAVALSANLYERGYVTFLAGNPQAGKRLLRDSLTYANEAGDAMCQGCALRALGEVAAAGGAVDEARGQWRSSLRHFEKVGDRVASDEVRTLLDTLS